MKAQLIFALVVAVIAAAIIAWGFNAAASAFADAVTLSQGGF